MIKFLAFIWVCLGLGSCKPNDQITPFVVGGTPVEEGLFPFCVSLRKKPDVFHCGGAIISDTHILTAQHCVNPKVPELGDPDKILVGIGSVELQKQTLVEVEKVIAHPDYITSGGHHDIAILKLKKPLEFSENVQAIDFPYEKDLVGKEATAMGWGKIEENKPFSPILMQINSTILSNEECQKKYVPAQGVIGSGDICLSSPKGRGMCMGDSGSPSVYRENGINYLVGIMSRSIPCARGFPDVFMRVSEYNEWIQKSMKE